MSGTEPRSSGTHVLAPTEVVDLIAAFDVVRRYVKGVNLADLRLTSRAAADGRCRVTWSVPGAPITRDVDDPDHRSAHLIDVPAYLGRIDAATHIWPVAGHRSGSGPFAPDPFIDEMPAVFEEFITKAGPLSLGLVGPEGGVTVTDRGVFHTLLPRQPIVANLGYNLGTYLASLADPGEAVPWEWCETAMACYRATLVCAFATRSAHNCPCGRDFDVHVPRWADVYAYAAHATGRPERLPLTDAATVGP
ncbi:hypothetical protein ACWGR4_34820 [Embleya sp. NPDC055664]